MSNHLTHFHLVQLVPACRLDVFFNKLEVGRLDSRLSSFVIISPLYFISASVHIIHSSLIIIGSVGLSPEWDLCFLERKERKSGQMNVLHYIFHLSKAFKTSCEFICSNCHSLFQGHSRVVFKMALILIVFYSLWEKWSLVPNSFV